MKVDEFDKFFNGNELYGDDFDDEEIRKWFESEKIAYANLETSNSYNYEYHELNKIFYKKLPKRKFENVLLIGGYYCKEILPILDSLENIYNIEPAIQDKIININGKMVKVITPLLNSQIPFENDYFDLIIALIVLHHIPNVTYLIKEMYRTSKSGAISIIREPIVSMGDWRIPRKGLTKNERGIPLQYFRKNLKHVGFEIENEILYDFPLVKKIYKFPYKNRYITYLDLLLAKIFSWNYRYHHTKIFHKFSPCSVGYILRKIS